MSLIRSIHALRAWSPPRNRARGERYGAVAVEGTIVLVLLLLLLFAMLELGLATFQYNLLASATRRVAREAIVRGQEAPPERTSWGPAAYSDTLAGNTEAASVATSVLATMEPADVAIEITWPDGGNDESDRVRVRLEYVHRPFLPLLQIANPIVLKAECTMRILH